jgi:hypothetical protein
MLTWDQIHARESQCLVCGTSVRLAGPLSDKARERAPELLLRNNPVYVIRLFAADTGSSLEEARATHRHLVRQPGHCHSCGVALPTGELVDCPACQELNIGL